MLLRAIKFMIILLRDCILTLWMFDLIERTWKTIKNHIDNTKKMRELSEEELKELRELKELLIKHNMLDKIKEMEELC